MCDDHVKHVKADETLTQQFGGGWIKLNRAIKADEFNCKVCIQIKGVCIIHI